MPRMLIVVMILVAGWVFLGAPIPVKVAKPMRPDASLPTFAQRKEEGALLRQADRDGLLQRDPDREEERRALIDAFALLKASPCDTGLRRDFASTLKPFMNRDMMSDGPEAVETVEIDGRVLAATRYLDGAALWAIDEALTEGYLRVTDLPGAAGAAAWMHESKPKSRNAAFQMPDKIAECEQQSRNDGS